MADEAKRRRASPKNLQHVHDKLLDAAELCNREGAQFTALRRIVLTMLLEADRPRTAYQLLDQLRPLHKGAAPPTIYRTLDFLIEKGLVLRVEALNAFLPSPFHDRPHGPLQFLICKQCGDVGTIENSDIANALGRAAEEEGFRSERATVELAGICGSCSTDRAGR